MIWNGAEVIPLRIFAPEVAGFISANGSFLVWTQYLDSGPVVRRLQTDTDRPTASTVVVPAELAVPLVSSSGQVCLRTCNGKGRDSSQEIWRVDSGGILADLSTTLWGTDSPTCITNSILDDHDYFYFLTGKGIEKVHTSGMNRSLFMGTDALRKADLVGWRFTMIGVDNLGRLYVGAYLGQSNNYRIYRLFEGHDIEPVLINDQRGRFFIRESAVLPYGTVVTVVEITETKEALDTPAGKIITNTYGLLGSNPADPESPIVLIKGTDKRRTNYVAADQRGNIFLHVVRNGAFGTGKNEILMYSLGAGISN